MNQTRHYLTLLSLVILCSTYALADSKRVHVYQLPQKTWVVRPGDTLSGIAAILLPDSLPQQHSLMQSIFDINPRAFIDGDPNKLKALAKLILPGEIQTYSLPKDKTATRVQEFSWGSIQTRKQ